MFWILNFDLNVWQHFQARRSKAEIEYFKVSYKTKWNSTRQSGIIGQTVSHGPTGRHFDTTFGTIFPLCLVKFLFSCNEIESTVKCRTFVNPLFDWNSGIPVNPVILGRIFAFFSLFPLRISAAFYCSSRE